MTYDELVYRVRLKVFRDYDTGKYNVSNICKRYGYSRTWFYKFKERRERLGNEGLRPIIRKAPKMPNQIPIDIEYKV